METARLTIFISCVTNTNTHALKFEKKSAIILEGQERLNLDKNGAKRNMIQRNLTNVPEISQNFW